MTSRLQGPRDPRERWQAAVGFVLAAYEGNEEAAAAILTREFRQNSNEIACFIGEVAHVAAEIARSWEKGIPADRPVAVLLRSILAGQPAGGLTTSSPSPNPHPDSAANISRRLKRRRR